MLRANCGSPFRSFKTTPFLSKRSTLPTPMSDGMEDEGSSGLKRRRSSRQPKPQGANRPALVPNYQMGVLRSECKWVTSFANAVQTKKSGATPRSTSGSGFQYQCSTE
eukprot:2203914-Rhodomonas_salina.1